MKFLLLFLITCFSIIATCIKAQTNISINVKPGYNLITLPLQSSDSTSSINSVLTNTSPTIPFGSFVSVWDVAHSRFITIDYAGGDGIWYDPTFSYIQTNGLPPGGGFFLFMPSDGNGGVASATITVVGTALQGTNSYSENSGYGFYGNFEPFATDLVTNGFPITVTGSSLYTWNNSKQRYDAAYYGVTAEDNGTYYPAWYDGNYAAHDITIPIGQGFVYFNAGPPAVWRQIYFVH